MAENSYGLASVTYGVYTLTGFVVQTYDITKKPGVVAEIFDEQGRRVHVRYDDETHELSLDLYVDGGTEPVAGEVLTYNSVKYEITEVALKGSNKDCVKVGVKAKKSEHITLP